MQTTWKFYDLYFDWRRWRLSLTHHDNVGAWGGRERCMQIGPLVIEWRDEEQMLPDHDMR